MAQNPFEKPPVPKVGELQELEERLRATILRPKNVLEDAYDCLMQEVKEYEVDMLSWARRRKEAAPGKEEQLFRDAFGNEKVDADIALVARRREEYGEDVSEYELAKAIEALLVTDLWGAGWFGPFDKVEVTPASKYDDYVHHTDAIVEFPEEERGEKSNLLAVVDVTTASGEAREGVLAKKWDTVRSLIEHKKLGGFEYYLSPSTGKPDPHREGVPHVILYVPKEVAERLLVTAQFQRRYAKDKDAKEFLERKLEGDAFRRDFQAEIYEFLGRCRNYAIFLAEHGKNPGEQRKNVEVIEALLARLRELGFPTQIASPELKSLFDRVFTIPGQGRRAR